MLWLSEQCFLEIVSARSVSLHFVDRISGKAFLDCQSMMDETHCRVIPALTQIFGVDVLACCPRSQKVVSCHDA